MQGRNAVKQAGFVVPRIGLETLGMKNLGTVHWNMSVAGLYEEAIRRREGAVGDGGAFIVRTGVHTGRSPKDKFIIEDSLTRDTVDWGSTNKPMSPERYRALYNRMISYAQRRDLFVRDCWAGADPAHRIGVRVVNDLRSADVTAGGQGAPLVPIYHAALVHDLPRPVAVVNVGGVANVTYIGKDDDLIAFSNLHLAKADHFEGAGLILQEEPKGRLPLAIGG